jgi:hypothetical protein
VRSAECSEVRRLVVARRPAVPPIRSAGTKRYCRKGIYTNYRIVGEMGVYTHDPVVGEIGYFNSKTIVGAGHHGFSGSVRFSKRC